MRGPSRLGDAPDRDYGPKLDRFAAFAAPELGALVADLALATGSAVLDAGCGAGAWLALLSAAATPRLLCGADLSLPHLVRARKRRSGAVLVCAALDRLPLAPVFDAAFAINAVGHSADPLGAVGELARVVQRGGRVILGRSHLLPEMLFAWNEPLERRVVDALRRSYRERYGVAEADLADDRALVGLARRAGLAVVRVRTTAIERIAPLSSADREYLQEAVMVGLRTGRTRALLDAPDAAELDRLADPDSPTFWLDRPDFHYVETLTLVDARVP
jgi:SAM-dependent methyltransferase